MTEVCGTVRSVDGQPIEGVLVMGADLNYAETDSQGRFQLKRPDIALFFWCTGFLPTAKVLGARDREINMVLQRVIVLRASA